MEHGLETEFLKIAYSSIEAAWDREVEVPYRSIN